MNLPYAKFLQQAPSVVPEVYGTGEVSMNTFAKIDFPVSDIRRFLEPSPIVLISSARKGRTNIMTMGWHMLMEFQPSLVGCVRAVYAAPHPRVSRHR